MDSLTLQVKELELQSCFLETNEQKQRILEQYKHDLDQLFSKLDELDDFMDEELGELDKQQKLIDALDAQKQVLQAVLEATKRLPVVQPTPAVTNTPIKRTTSPAVPQKKVSNKTIALVDPVEFKTIPAYSLNRMSMQKLNQHITELNTFIKDKYSILNIPFAKMAKWQRDILYAHKENATPDTKGLVYITEKELREKHSYTNSQFALNAVGRNVIAILRSLGRIKEVRGGGQNRICLI